MPDLCTVAAVKSWLAISAGMAVADDKLADLVSGTSADFLRAIERTDFLEATYTEVREGDGGSRLSMRHWPITAVASVTVSGTSLAASPDRVATGYYFDEDLDPEKCNQLYVADGVFTDAAPVVVAYTAGYADPPDDVVQAVVEWCAARFKGRPGQGLNSERAAGGEHTTYDREAAMPARTADVVNYYKRTWPSLDKRNDDRDYRITRINRTYTEVVK